MDTIARDLGYSKSTISRAFSGKGRVNAETREEIFRYCKKLGYRTELLAEERRTYNLLVILPPGEEWLEVPFFHNCLMGICEKAKEVGYNIMIISLEMRELQPLRNIVENSKIDGVILLRTLVIDRTVEYLTQCRIPFLVIGEAAEHSVQHIDNDTVQACRDMTSYLIKKGNFRIAVIGGDINHTATQKRLEGFKEGFSLNRRNFAQDMIYLNCNTQKDVHEVAENIVRAGEAECILCMDSKICCQVLEKFQSMHVSVPKDMKVASFYDSYFLEFNVPPITSLRFDEKKLGMIACEKLVDRIQGKECRSMVISEYEIMTRESTE